MIYVVGVFHHLQYYPVTDPYKSYGFYEYIYGMCRRHAIDIVVEEFNEEAINNTCGATDSVCRVVANSLELKHVFCEANSNIRKELGISVCDNLKKETDKNNWKKRKRYKENKADFSRRENYWIEVIRESTQCEVNQRRILFVCGNNHVGRIIFKFKSLGWENKRKKYFFAAPVDDSKRIYLDERRESDAEFNKYWATEKLLNT